MKTPDKTVFALVQALYGRIVAPADQILQAVLGAAKELTVDLDSPALTAADLACVLDTAEQRLTSSDDPELTDLYHDEDFSTIAWCGKLITGTQAAVDEHLDTCLDCQRECERVAAAGPPGYSAGLSELGYEGDG